MADEWYKKLVSKEQLAEGKSLADKLGIRVEDALLKLEYIDPSQVGQAQAKQFGFEFLDISTIQIPSAVIQLVPESVARENVVIPLSLDNIDKLRFIINKDIKQVVASKEIIQQAINRHYGQSETESVDSMIAEFTE